MNLTNEFFLFSTNISMSLKFRYSQYANTTLYIQKPMITHDIVSLLTNHLLTQDDSILSCKLLQSAIDNRYVVKLQKSGPSSSLQSQTSTFGMPF